MLIFSQEVKEVIDPPDPFAAMPEEVFLLPRQLVVGGVEGKSTVPCLGDKASLPARHLGSVPALDTPLTDGEGLVGHHKILIDPHHHAEALTGGAGTDGALEAKELVRRLLEDDPICLEAVAEGARPVPPDDPAVAVPLKERSLHRVPYPTPGSIGIALHPQAVNHQQHITELTGGGELPLPLHEIIDPLHLVPDQHTRVAIGPQDGEVVHR